MIYSIKEKEFKSLGYIFQKMYARDYKCYHKDIDNLTIWCWVAKKQIEINDWHSHTDKIIKFYQENRDSDKVSTAHKLFNNNETWKYMSLLFNYETGEILWKREVVKQAKKTNDSYDSFNITNYFKSGTWSEMNLNINLLDETIKELEKIKYI